MKFQSPKKSYLYGLGVIAIALGSAFTYNLGAFWKTTTPSCGGNEVGGFCWYLSANNQSCTSVCSGHGGHHTATNDYAGYGGNNTNCQAVLTSLGYSGGVSAFTAGATNTGCVRYTSSGANIRFVSIPTDPNAVGSGQLRACACNN